MALTLVERTSIKATRFSVSDINQLSYKEIDSTEQFLSYGPKFNFSKFFNQVRSKC
jgi:hypothetical protein